ncbi:hypothetical protein [Candidatus Enterovibrio escicola]
MAFVDSTKLQVGYNLRIPRHREFEEMVKMR